MDVQNKCPWKVMNKFVQVDACRNMGLRILRNSGTSRGTSGTLVKRILLLVPQYPYKNHTLGEVPQFLY